MPKAAAGCQLAAAAASAGSGSRGRSGVSKVKARVEGTCPVSLGALTPSCLAWSEAYVGMMKTMLQPFLMVADEETGGGGGRLRRQLQMSFNYCLTYLRVSKHDINLAVPFSSCGYCTRGLI
jgi:hypothetical protein